MTTVQKKVLTAIEFEDLVSDAIEVANENTDKCDISVIDADADADAWRAAVKHVLKFAGISVVQDEQVEKLAIALLCADENWDDSWDETSESDRKVYRGMARAALKHLKVGAK